MNTTRIIDALNSARADELHAIIQYMKHHYEAEGMESPEIMDRFKETAIDEMRHAESLAERIVYLGGTPTKQPSEIMTGGDLRKMISDDLGAENGAISKYKGIIKICFEEEDSTTRLMVEQILSQEEGHADLWETILGVKKGK